MQQLVEDSSIEAAAHGCELKYEKREPVTVAGDPELRLDMNFMPGDIQFLHNHTILHARTAYEDWPEVERKRHLLRLWLAPPDARPLPPVFAECYGGLTAGERGGIICKGTRLHAPLLPG